jgi:hypothetical protein
MEYKVQKQTTNTPTHLHVYVPTTFTCIIHGSPEFTKNKRGAQMKYMLH